MSAFAFDLSIHYEKQISLIKPDKNLSSFKEKVKDLYKLSNPKFQYRGEQGNKILIENERDYVSMVIYGTTSNKPIEIFLMEKEQKKESNIEEIKKEVSNYVNDDYYDNICEYDLYRDTRNRKFRMCHSKWRNQSFSFTNRRRIYYIKVKKDMQREKQKERININTNQND